MTLDQLGNLGDFAAAVATLAYLALQIRENTSALRSSAFQAFTESIDSSNPLIASDRDPGSDWFGGSAGSQQAGF